MSKNINWGHDKPQERKELSDLCSKYFKDVGYLYISSDLPRYANVDYAYEDFEMDVFAAHFNGCPLDLHKIKNSGNFCPDIVHDLVGIYKNICRETGKLQNNFIPRFALKNNSEG